MKKNIVYIFGAGASKDFGMPLGSEIFVQAHRLPRLMRTCQLRADLVLALKECKRYLRYIFTELPRNTKEYPPFEEVLTFLWDYRKSERFDSDSNKLISVFSNPNGARDVFDLLVNLLNLTLAGCAAISKSRRQSLAKFVRKTYYDCKSIAFISMNYDTFLDQALVECVEEGIISDFTYGIELYDFVSRRDIRKSGIFLLKPHGSLNLIYCPHKTVPDGQGFFYSSDDLIATTSRKSRCPVCFSVPKPLIIPPLYNKAEFLTGTAVKTEHRINFRASPETYRINVDYRVREILAQADEIIVIGYSMPPYDYDFRTLFVSSLMRNERRKRLKLKLITKGSKRQINAVSANFKRFVGSVEILASDGFLNYLRRQGFQI